MYNGLRRFDNQAFSFENNSGSQFCDKDDTIHFFRQNNNSFEMRSSGAIRNDGNLGMSQSPSSSHYPQTNGYSEFQSSFEKINDIGVNSMSIGCSIITPSGIMMFSDSRSSKIQMNSENFIFTDDYKKVVYSKQFNCVLFSTGLNEFHNKTFEETVYECEQISGNANLNYDDFEKILLTKISTAALLSNLTVNVCIGRYLCTNNIVYPSVSAFEITSEIDFNGKLPTKYRYRFSGEQNSIFSSGETWLTNFFYNIRGDIFAGMEEESIYQYIANLLTKAIEFENSFNPQPRIGGKIQCVRLSRNGDIKVFE